MIKLITEMSYSEKLENEQDEAEESRRGLILINNWTWVEMGAGPVGVRTAAGERGDPDCGLCGITGEGVLAYTNLQDFRMETAGLWIITAGLWI